MGFDQWLLFTSIALVATATPGPAILLVSSHSVSHGLRKAIMTILGNISGLFIMSAFSIAGLSSMLLYSTTIFIIIKFIGAAYLVFLGVKLWRYGFFGKKDIHSINAENSHQHVSLSSLYVQGLFIALSNPKAIAFTTALFPQFINTSEPLLAQFTLLVSTFMFLSFICLIAYGYSASRLRQSQSLAGVSRFLGKIFGSAFIVSGMILANATQKQP